MARGETTVVKTIIRAERLNNSVNGNPRYRLYFADGSAHTTQSDSACTYDVENLAKHGATLELTLTRAGRVCRITNFAVEGARVVHTGYPEPQEVWVIDRLTNDSNAGRVAHCRAESDRRRRARYWVSLLAPAST
jgi:hypothetical protein